MLKAPRHHIMMTTETFDRMRLFQNKSQISHKSNVICSTVFDLHGRFLPDDAEDISAARQPISIRPEVEPPQK